MHTRAGNSMADDALNEDLSIVNTKEGRKTVTGHSSKGNIQDKSKKSSVKKADTNLKK